MSQVVVSPGVVVDTSSTNPQIVSQVPAVGVATGTSVI